MTDARASQAGLVALVSVTPEARASQAGLVAVAAIQPDIFVSQAGLIVIGRLANCSSRRCQLWTLERTDGVTLRFTSHDEPVWFSGQLYEACGSLNETASEQSSDQGSVGSIELSGILSSDHITEEDIYAGKYDDAFVQVWRASWDSDNDTINRVAAGWTGAVSQGEQGFKAEVLGPGARMLQKALLQTVTPNCRFDYGDPATCGVDAEARAIGGAVTNAISRSFMYADIIDPANGSQWDRGKIRWVYGANAGQVCRVREVHFDTGLIIFWDRPGYTPEPGDDFILLPGCDKGFDGGCAVYNNRLRFGGYPDVPGQDAIAQVPLAKA